MKKIIVPIAAGVAAVAGAAAAVILLIRTVGSLRKSRGIALNEYRRLSKWQNPNW